MGPRDHKRLTSNFFRQVNSGDLIQQFFESFGIWVSLLPPDDATNDQLFEAWQSYDEEDRPRVEEELKKINDIATEPARATLLEAARECQMEDVEELSLHKLAITLYLDHREGFELAYNFYFMEKAENLRVFLAEFPVPCSPTEDQIAEFKSALGDALKGDSEGPRLKVEIEPRHSEKWMAAIPHETFVTPDQVFDKADQITTMERRPVYEMILIYYPDSGILKLKVGRGKKKLQNVAHLFAGLILGQDSEFFASDQVVTFEPIRNPEFSFVREPGDKFQDAFVTGIRFTPHSRPYLSHDIRDTQRFKQTDVLSVLEDEGFARSQVEVRELRIHFRFSMRARDTKTVILGIPNATSLDETPRDRYVESLLERWGFLKTHALRSTSSGLERLDRRMSAEFRGDEVGGAFPEAARHLMRRGVLRDMGAVEFLPDCVCELGKESCESPIESDDDGEFWVACKHLGVRVPVPLEHLARYRFYGLCWGTQLRAANRLNGPGPLLVPGCLLVGDGAVSGREFRLFLLAPTVERSGEFVLPQMPDLGTRQAVVVQLGGSRIHLDYPTLLVSRALSADLLTLDFNWIEKCLGPPVHGLADEVSNVICYSSDGPNGRPLSAQEYSTLCNEDSRSKYDVFLDLKVRKVWRNGRGHASLRDKNGKATNRPIGEQALRLLGEYLKHPSRPMIAAETAAYAGRGVAPRSASVMFANVTRAIQGSAFLKSVARGTRSGETVYAFEPPEDFTWCVIDRDSK